jgi:AraC-like DNA-binding protein
MYREHLPPAALAPYVDRFWTSDAVAPAPEVEPRRILPDGCIDILIELTGDLARPRVVGTMTRALLIPAGAQPRIVAVRFRPGAAAAFLRVDADELTDLELELPALGLDLEIDPRDPRGSLERWLLARLPAHPQRVADHAIARLVTAAPSLPELARETGWSRQWLTRECRRRVGVPPKQLARVARLQRAIITLQAIATRPRVPAHGLASLAPALGYFDQAHMAKDFRELAGCTPREAVSIFPIRSVYGAA